MKPTLTPFSTPPGSTPGYQHEFALKQGYAFPLGRNCNQPATWLLVRPTL